MNIISNDGSNKLNRSRKARVSYKVQRTINASLNAATSTRAVSSNPNFVTRQKIEIIYTMTNLSTECLIQLTKLGYDATPFNQILKQNAKREMRLRLGKVTVADVLAAQPVTTNLLKFMRASIKMIGVSNLQSFIASMTQKLTLSDIS